MKRKIIKIDEEKCNGCGLCIPDCPEGALQVIDGKARLVSDLFCDGLGACIGHCPEGAITVEEREAAPYDEKKVMANIAAKGDATIKAHLAHLKNHNAEDFYNTALEYLEENGYRISDYAKEEVKINVCPGMRSRSLKPAPSAVNQSISAPAPVSGGTGQTKHTSELINWPVQMHLVNPDSPHFKKSDLLIAADCAGFAVADFHGSYLKGKTLVIACPKLDNSAELYTDRIISLIETAEVNTITVLIMEVPCCMGLTAIVRNAAAQASRKVPVKEIVAGIDGEVVRESWL
ncbi:MAG: 4Fe-4S binding protein [Spirochaetia bacterium]|jgi:ferredoxin|nr:4Fe-4S binding protein [Spirochaetia bacterium]